MKKRTVTRRNLTGGFLGGVLGILAFSLLHPAVLPVGCFLGVIFGWWYWEISQSTRRGCRRGALLTRWTCRHAQEFILTPTRRLGEIQIDLKPYLRAIHWCLFAVVWLLRSPVIFVRWLWAQEIHRVAALRSAAALLTIGLNALWLVPLAVGCWHEVSPTAGLPVGVPVPATPILAFLGVILLTLLVVFTPMFFLTGDESISRKRRWCTYRQNYRARGPGRYALKCLVSVLMVELIVAVGMICGLLWFSTLGGIFIAAVLVPLLAIVGLVKGIYRVAIRSGHWLCFGATVLTTALTAYSSYPYLHDARVLWLTALAAGVMSALVTEAVRRSLAKGFDLSKRARVIAGMRLEEQFVYVWRRFWRPLMIRFGRAQNYVDCILSKRVLSPC
ncbi:MAG: hypothetical protein U9M92_00180 [Patescibacteria group bacterium]|nr:hypothetical protein [Patescibacteria group bacterium]